MASVPSQSDREGCPSAVAEAEVGEREALPLAQPAFTDDLETVSPGAFFIERFELPLGATRVTSRSPTSLVATIVQSGDRVLMVDRRGGHLRELCRDFLETGLEHGTFPIVTVSGRIVAGAVVSLEPDGGLVLEVLDTGNHPARYEGLREQFGISETEFGTLAAYCLGVSIRAIAAVRHRSVETVKRQLKDAMGKLGVTRQEDAVRIFFGLMIPAMCQHLFPNRGQTQALRRSRIRPLGGFGESGVGSPNHERSRSHRERAGLAMAQARG